MEVWGLKYDNIQKWQITFTSGLNDMEKIPIIWKKALSKNYLELNPLQKIQWMHRCSKDCHVQSIPMD